MERRLVGMVLLLVALTVLVAVPRLLTPDLVARASALPLPAPPPVGACLRLDAVVSQVPCDEPHAAEVTARWAADASGRPAGDGDSRCRAAAFSYIDLGLVGAARLWRPAFGSRSWLVHAPPAQRAGDRGWSVCVVAPSRAATSVGSVHQQGREPSARPAAFGLCVTVDEILVSCDRPHHLEYLTGAVGFARSLVDEREAARWRTGCSDPAAELIDNLDPTLGGRLSVEFVTLSADPGTGLDASPSLVYGLCAVRVTDGRDLIGSLYGLGDGALPLG